MSAALSTPVIGVDIDAVTAGTTTDGENAVVALGTEVVGADGNLYRYVQAGAAISTTTDEPVAIGIDEDNQATILTGATALDGYMIGFAPRQILADNALFWARMGGSFTIRVAASAPVDAVLGLPSSTDGRLAAAPTTASATNAVILGVTITAVGSASASVGNTLRTAIVRSPLAKSPGV
jgi:hypothetical protein